MAPVTLPQHGKELRDDRQKSRAMPLDGLGPVDGKFLSLAEQKGNISEQDQSVKRTANKVVAQFEVRDAALAAPKWQMPSDALPLRI